MKESAESQEGLPEFLIGSLAGNEILEETCPSAKTLHGWSETIERWCVIQIRCKRWGCRHCGERKIRHFGLKCQNAEPNRLITLTVDTKIWESPREAFEGTKRMVTRLAVKVRRAFGEFEYFKVLEVTKKGWPHYHLIVRSGYIPHRFLSDEWNHLTGAPIVDVRKIKKPADVYFYIMKYLAKQKYIPWTDRRVSWSKHFFEKENFERAVGLKLTQVGWLDDHPRDVLRREYHPFRISIYSKDCWILPEDVGCEIGIPMATLAMKRRKKSS